MSSSVARTFWPWSARAAMLATPLILIALLVLLWGVHATSTWPEGGSIGWAVLGVALLSLIPVLLFFLDGMAGRHGVLEWRGLKLSFASAPGPAAGAMVPANVTAPGTPVIDSSMQSVLRTSQAAARSRLLVVDLADGQAWWESRLLMLCSVAATRNEHAAVVLVADLGGRPSSFVGWAAPAALRDRLLLMRPELRAAYQSAAADSVRVMTGTPPGVPFPVPQESVPPMPPAEVDLARHIGRVEAQHTQPLSAGAVRDLFAPDLVTRCIDRSAPFEQWIRDALTAEEEFVAITDAGRYAGLMTWRQVANSVLLGLIPQMPGPGQVG